MRAGVLVPSSNVLLEQDASRLLPPGISAHFSRMKIARDDPEQLAALADLAPAAAELLADAAVGAIAFGCTTGSLNGGLGYDRLVIERIEAATGIPTTTTTTALVDALQRLGAGRVALVSPYEPWLNDRVEDFLRASGFAVTTSFGFGCADPLAIAAIAPEQIADQVRLVHTGDIDAVVIACTAFRGVEATALLTDVPTPVLTSNQVTYWKLVEMLLGTSSAPADLIARAAIPVVP